MAESACLRRSISHPSSAFHHPPEGDPIRCLTESVSFGRFVSESLAWERWSAFSHNRHLEEVQQISKAGSVAEKRAFFEAHYKRRAAMKDAAKPGQANVKARSDPGPGTSDGTCSVSLTSSQSVETVNAVMVADAEISQSADVKCVLDIGQSSQVEAHETGVVRNVSVEPSIHLEGQMQIGNAEVQINLDPDTVDRTCVASLSDLQSVETVNVVLVPDAEINQSADAKCVLDIGQSSQLEAHEICVVESVNDEPSISLEDQMQFGNADAQNDLDPGTSGRSCSVSPAGLQSVVTVNVVVPDAEINQSADAKCVPEIDQNSRDEQHISDAAGNANIVVNLEDEMQVGNTKSKTCDTNKVVAPKERTSHEDGSTKKNVALRASNKLLNPSMIASTHRASKLSRASVKQEAFSATIADSPSSGSTHAGFISKKNSGSKALHMSISFSSCSGEKIPRNSKASVHGLAPGTSKPEQYIRNNLSVNKSISGRNITSGSLQRVAEDCSRSSINSGSKPKPPTVSSPFRFRSEERAIRRREKLEERCSASEAENIHQEGKQRCKITKTQQSTNCGSRLDEAPGHELKLRARTTRSSVVTPQPPKSGRKPPLSEAADKRRFIHSHRALDGAAFRNRLLTLSVASSPQTKKVHENSSPNIQR